MISKLAWWWLQKRGKVWQVNTPENCHHFYTNEQGQVRDRGWYPLFSVRYGKIPVYFVKEELR